jgi:hypothetical protein
MCCKARKSLRGRANALSVSCKPRKADTMAVVHFALAVQQCVRSMLTLCT